MVVNSISRNNNNYLSGRDNGISGLSFYGESTFSINRTRNKTIRNYLRRVNMWACGSAGLIILSMCLIYMSPPLFKGLWAQILGNRGRLFWASLQCETSVPLVTSLSRLLNLSSGYTHRRHIKSVFVYVWVLVVRWIGVFISVRGKISVSGNARTRELSIIGGVRSVTQVRIWADPSYGTVRTLTGCLGVYGCVWY